MEVRIVKKFRLSGNLFVVVSVLFISFVVMGQIEIEDVCSQEYDDVIDAETPSASMNAASTLRLCAFEAGYEAALNESESTNETGSAVAVDQYSILVLDPVVVPESGQILVDGPENTYAIISYSGTAGWHLSNLSIGHLNVYVDPETYVPMAVFMVNSIPEWVSPNVQDAGDYEVLRPESEVTSIYIESN